MYLYTLDPGESQSGSIIAVDYSYWGDGNTTTYLSPRGYLQGLQFFD